MGSIATTIRSHETDASVVSAAIKCQAERRPDPLLAGKFDARRGEAVTDLPDLSAATADRVIRDHTTGTVGVLNCRKLSRLLLGPHRRRPGRPLVTTGLAACGRPSKMKEAPASAGASQRRGYATAKSRTGRTKPTIMKFRDNARKTPAMVCCTIYMKMSRHPPPRDADQAGTAGRRVARKLSASYISRSLRRESPAPYREGEGGRGEDPSKPRSPA